MEENKKTVSLPYLGIPKLFPFLRKYRARIIIMVLMGLLSSSFDAIYPLFNRYALNTFVGGRTVEGLGLFIASYMGVKAVQMLVDYKNLSDCGFIEMSTNRDLRDASFNHLQTLSFSYFNRFSVGYIHSRVMSDTGQIGELVSWRLMDFVWSISYVIATFVVMLTVQPRLTLYILIIIPITVLLMVFFQRKLVAFNRKIREINSKITGNFNEGITGAKTIKVLDIEDKMSADFEKDTSEMKKTAVRESHYSALFISTVTFMSSIVLAIVLDSGGRLTSEGLMQLGTLSVFMTYALSILDPLQNIIITLSAVFAIQPNIERLTKLLEEKTEVVDSPEVVEKYGDTFDPKKENWEELLGDVEFRDVTFRYPDGEENVLEHFSLKVPQGTNIAIVGETGAGKSTLVNLVCRFYEPTEGQILIDGRDARERSQLWLHSSIGYVLQTPHLFSGTVRDNLRYGRPEATDEEIMEALRLVSAEEVIAKMDKGLDSDVGEGGGMLSTGEKQLLSFARALLADPRILVLDEATSSIDTVTEKAIQNAINTVIKGRTSFVIAHRLSTIVDADMIIVVKDGKITGQGTHKELMAQKGYYYELYTRQYEEMVWNS
ncbi:MAG: ABC transporter ATP-binding protein/permease [Lachnospiraceae bacterium]|nr:ABC transporter ATP-binding protein/permease [Lachnospiraceae bacterium]